MAGEPRMLLLGELEMKGGRFEFHPAAGPWRATAGEEVHLAVRYRYEEASRAREATAVALIVELDGQGPRRSDLRIRDRPLARDDAEGFVSCGAAMASAGRKKGRYVVEARFREGGWFGEKERGRTGFRHEAEFEVSVD